MAYWTGSPDTFQSGYSYVIVLNLVDCSVKKRLYGARGVVSLSSDAKLLGSGTYNDVYTVS